MSEVLVRYTASVTGQDGLSYVPQACGGLADDGLWEGWIEFVSDGTAVRTGRETEQPNRDDLMYWAQGLTTTYLEGALVRATAEHLSPAPEIVAAPVFSGPARPASPHRLKPQRAILDPFVTFDQGEQLLRGQLAALSHDNLVTIADDYQLGISGASSIESRALIDQIVMAVRARSRAADLSLRPQHADGIDARRPPGGNGGGSDSDDREQQGRDEHGREISGRHAI